MTKPVRVRFAPSPTGRLHIGGARTALYDYLWARSTGGQFILRIEDTDQKRYDPDSEAEMMAAMRWLGLQWDEGPDVGGPHAPYRQSERKEIYQKYAWELVEQGYAYPCFCTPERLDALREEQKKHKRKPRYDRHCRNIPLAEAKERIASGESYVIRFKTPLEGSITCHDMLRGPITYQNKTLDDFILVKSNGLAVYHLAAMVDDHLMNITHVLRGEEWLPTFPLHVHIYNAFGWEQPTWVHLSVFLSPTGKGKMSKREGAQLLEQGYATTVNDLRDLGYTPEGLINWIALMGWSYDDHTEFFTLQDLVEKFDPTRLSTSPAAVNFSKLDHFNGLHIRALSKTELMHRVRPFLEQAGYHPSEEMLEKLIPLLQPRLKTLRDAPEVAGFFFREEVTPSAERLVHKKVTPEQALLAAQRLYELLDALPEITLESGEQPVRALAEELGLKAGVLFGLLREAVTGQAVSPPIFETMEIVGKETVLKRLQKAIAILQELQA